MGKSYAALEEVVVTAQKRAESLQDVPIAINALTGDMLDEFGVTDSDDLTNLYPNLSLKTYTSINSGFSIRGVGTNNFHVNAQPAVGTYADEVSLPSPFTSQFGLFDMERVEVLRGPQNTLFGRNTTGGAVNFISHKPDPDEGLNGYIRTIIGNEGKEDVEFAIGIPISDTFAGRLAVNTVNRDDVFHDVVDDENLGRIERHSGRFQLRWFASENTDVLFNLHAGYNRSDRTPRKAIGFWEAGSPNILGAIDCPILRSGNPERFEKINNCVTVNNAGPANAFNPSTPGDWNDVKDVANTASDVDFEGVFVKVEHQFENMALTSITSYDTVEVLFQSNISATGTTHFFPLQEAEYDVFNQELRLASTNESAFRWIGGLYYSNEEDILGTNIRTGFFGQPPFTTVPSVVVDQEVDIFSAYGQFEFDLTNTLTLTTGLRFTKDEKSGTSTARVLAGTDTGRVGAPVASPEKLYTIDFIESVTNAGAGLCPPPVGGLPCILSFDVEQVLEEWGGKIGLDWKFNDFSLGYISYSRGFKSGSFDTRALAAFAGTADKAVDPEFLDAFEIGVKTTLLDNTLELNAALFYYEWQDLQTFATDTNGAPAFLNIPETELIGAEIEIKWAPGKGWFVQGGIGWTDSEIIDSGGLVSAKEGAPVSNTPEFTLSGMIRKEFQLENGLLSLQTTFSYADETNSSNNDSPFQRIDSTFFVNARVSYQFGEEDQYEVALWGENLGEEKTCGQVGDEGNLSNAVTCLLNPGMAFYGVQAEYRF